MSTMNTYYFSRSKQQRMTYCKIFNIIRRILVVISVYLIFGLLFQHVYADMDMNNDPYQTQHGSVWLLPDNGVYIEALQMQTDVDYAVTGNIDRAKVKQRFKGTSHFHYRAPL